MQDLRGYTRPTGGQESEPPAQERVGLPGGWGGSIHRGMASQGEKDGKEAESKGLRPELYGLWGCSVRGGRAGMGLKLMV